MLPGLSLEAFGWSSLDSIRPCLVQAAPIFTPCVAVDIRCSFLQTAKSSLMPLFVSLSWWEDHFYSVWLGSWVKQAVSVRWWMLVWLVCLRKSWPVSLEVFQLVRVDTASWIWIRFDALTHLHPDGACFTLPCRLQVRRWNSAGWSSHREAFMPQKKGRVSDRKCPLI